MPHDSLVDVRQVVPDVHLDIRYASSHNVTGAPLPGYAAAAFIHASLTPWLADGADRLAAEGFRLVVYDAYRPLRAARALAQWARSTGQHWLLDGYISESSRHSRGTAIDVGLLHHHNDGPVDLGSGFDDFGPQAHTRNATGDALRHRLLLRRCMMAAGFEDYRREWWHFDAPGLDHLPLLDACYPDCDSTIPASEPTGVAR